jgi:AcrR family transcriptional regulator
MRVVNVYAGRMPTRAYGGVSAEERVAARRASLMEAGLDLFGTRGYAATGVKDVCRAAGVTDRYFYESFDDRKELFLAVFDARVDELFDAVVAAVAAAPPEPPAQLRAAIGTFLEMVTEDERTPRLVFSEPAAVGPEAEAHKRATLRRFSEAASATARPHVGGDDRLAPLIGLAIVGALERVVVEWQDGELHTTIDEVVDECVELFAGPFSARGARRARS